MDKPTPVIPDQPLAGDGFNAPLASAGRVTEIPAAPAENPAWAPPLPPQRPADLAPALPPRSAPVNGIVDPPAGYVPKTTDAIQVAPPAGVVPKTVDNIAVDPSGARSAPEAPAAQAPAAPVPPGANSPVMSPAVPDTAKKRTAVDTMPPPLAPAPAVTPAGWEGDLEASSASAGVNPVLMRRIATKESTNSATAANPNSSARGLFQITDETWNSLRVRYPQLNLTDRLDPKQQARVAPYYMKEIQTNLTRALGRAPTDAESYIGWFLGPTGSAVALKADPSTPVSQVISPDAIVSNPNVFNKVRTIGDLYAWAGQKMGDPTAAPKTRIDLTPYLADGKDHTHLDGMGWDLKSRLSNMIADMPPELQAKIKINSGYRSPERQAALFKEAVAKYGSEEAARKWVAPPGNSQHNHGNAADLGFGDDATKKWVHDNAARYGLGFPMGHEPWHIEPIGARDAKLAVQGVQRDPSVMAQRVPFTHLDDVAAARAHEAEAYSTMSAAGAIVNQDWMVSNALKSNGSQPYDPAFSVGADMLKERAAGVPDRYLGYLTASKSQQDFDQRLKQASRDAEIDRRLDATPYGTPMRIALNLADPAGLAIGLVAPLGGMAKGAQLGRLGMTLAAAADGALGAVATEIPSLLNKPGYEPQQALWAGLTGTAGYMAMNRHLWSGRVGAENVEAATQGMAKVKTSIEQGNFGQGSIGAAQVAGYRDPVRNDIEGLAGLSTEKSGSRWMDRMRFDMARRKNSENQVVAAVTDQLVQDTIGNRNTSKAVSVPVEAYARQMEEKTNVAWAREYDAAAADYRKRNNIGWYDWQAGGEVNFQRLGSAAVRNDDPTKVFDPAVERIAGAWKKNAEYYRELAKNPGKERGETLRPLPGAEDWSDAPTYLPRYTNWGKFNELNGEFGNGLRKLYGEAIARKNPDLDPDFAYRLGDYYYDRLARVEAGQEITTMKALSGSDSETLRRDLLSFGIDKDSVEKALYHIDQKAADTGGKSMTSRQKRRTLMDDNFSMPLTGRNGSREVAVAETWEDNLRSIIHSYNKQMSGTVAFGQMRIENPKWKPGFPAEERWLVDGIHSDGDWQKLVAQMRAHDVEIRHGDQLKTVEGEIKDLQFAYDAIRGVPSSIDRTRLGQAMRIVQNVNFVRLMSQAGWSSVAEFGKILGEFGVKNMLVSIPGYRDLVRNVKTGKLLRDELEDLEYAFTAGTDHLRGTGSTWTGGEAASALNDAATRSSRLDTIEKVTKKATRYTSMVTLAPLTTFQERWAMKAALAKFRDAAANPEKTIISEKRMRIMGIDADMQKRILSEISKHDEWVYGEGGRKIRILGLEKWEPQTRSALEHAISTWTRRAVQQNDLGQMNAVMGSPMAKLLFQFRNFTIGAWSKQTLSALHMHEGGDMIGFLSSMLFGSLAYTVQTNLNSLGLGKDDMDKVYKDKLNPSKIAQAGFQRAGASSLIPGMADFGMGIFGLDPLFNTRSTQQPTQGLISNPTIGMIDSGYKGLRGLTTSMYPDGHMTSGDVQGLSRGLNVLHNYPGMIQMMNLMSSGLPAK